MTTVSLAEIERLEFDIVDRLAAADLSNATRQKLQKALADLRKVKADYLIAHPELLRKITTEPHRKDAPNAPMPGGDRKVEPEHWRAPRELCGLTLHLSTGHQLEVPPSGIVEIHPDHHEVKEDLKGRGFRRMHELNKSGQAVDGSDPVALFRPSRLSIIGSDIGFLAALHRRAAQGAEQPCEIRRENPDGPAPSPTFKTSAAAFRRAYGLEV